jgi:hypothetical protein
MKEYQVALAVEFKSAGTDIIHRFIRNVFLIKRKVESNHLFKTLDLPIRTFLEKCSKNTFQELKPFNANFST